MIEVVRRRGPFGLLELLSSPTANQSEANTLILVDQFEELFLYSSLKQIDDAAAFVNLLLEASAANDRIYVALTMWSDFIGAASSMPNLAQKISETQFLTPDLTRDEAREAIVGPAEVFGSAVEPDVVNEILNEMGTEPDQLPIMQHLMMRMWDRMTAGSAETPRILSRTDYEAVGGFKNALSMHGDAVFSNLPERKTKVAEDVFALLVDSESANQDTRRPARFEEIVEATSHSASEIADVIDAFRTPEFGFLTPEPPRPLERDAVIDVSHESLLRLWKRLRGWVAQEAKQQSEAVEEQRRIAERERQSAERERQEAERQRPRRVHPNGRLLVSGSQDETVRVWSLASGRELVEIDDHEGDVFSVAFDADGGLLASASIDSEARIRQIEANVADLSATACQHIESVVASSDENDSSLSDRIGEACGELRD